MNSAGGDEVGQCVKADARGFQAGRLHEAANRVHYLHSIASNSPPGAARSSDTHFSLSFVKEKILHAQGHGQVCEFIRETAGNAACMFTLNPRVEGLWFMVTAKAPVFFESIKYMIYFWYVRRCSLTPPTRSIKLMAMRTRCETQGRGLLCRSWQWRLATM